MVEFILEKEQAPHLFVIRKQQRPNPSPSTSHGHPTILGYYYILDKVIYQAPTLHEALNARVSRCSSMLLQSFEKLKADLDPLAHLASSAGQDADHAGNEGGNAMDEGEEGQTFKWMSKGNERDMVGRRQEGYSAAEESRMNRAANMIDAVLSQLPIPRLPAEYIEKMPEHMRPKG